MSSVAATLEGAGPWGTEGMNSIVLCRQGFGDHLFAALSNYRDEYSLLENASSKLRTAVTF